MFGISLLIFPVLIALNAHLQPVESHSVKQSDRKFPNGFLFGAATAAHQVEGAWNVSGKGPSVWDHFAHNHPELIVDGQNADVGPDSYQFYEEDIKAVKSMGMNHYRFSIAWSRVLPDGEISSLNEAGIEYYNKLINKVREYGLEPMATMFHYDLPLGLQRFGGMVNSIFIDHFESYANLLFQRFGDRVKTWITFNEASRFCLKGYGTGEGPPMINGSGIGEYLCVHNVIKAHATAYHLYQKRYAKKFNGKIGVTLGSWYHYSDTNSTEDINRAMDFALGWMANPIFGKKGNYPAVMISQIKENSLSEGRDRSRLPVLSADWIKTIRGSADFLGLNYYTSRYADLVNTPYNNIPSYNADMRMRFTIKPEWKRAKSPWLYSVPTGKRDILRWIKKEYNNPAVIITENGWSDDGEMNDVSRIDYLLDHLDQVLDFVLNDKGNLKGYTAWTLIDNFEWTSGYTTKFGLFSVNMTSPLKERSAKASSAFMKEVIASRRVPAK